MTPINSRLAYLGGLLLLASCTRTVVSRPIVDLPPFPTLPICVEAHIVGNIEGERVVFHVQQLEAYREALGREQDAGVREEIQAALGLRPVAVPDHVNGGGTGEHRPPLRTAA